MPNELPPEKNTMMDAVEHSVRAMQNSLKWKALQIRIAGVAIALLIAACSLLGVVAVQANNTARTTNANSAALKADAIVQCEQSNTTRMLDKQVWTAFIQLLLTGNTSKTAASEGAAFEQQVAIAYAPKDCANAYANVSGASAQPAADPGVNTDAVTSETEHLRSYTTGNGALCLSIAGTAVAGTAVDSVPCGHDHAWTYYSTGELSPQGHPQVAVGDSGGKFVLKSAGTATDVHNGGYRANGPGGYGYYQLDFNNSKTYWHDNASGQAVTFDSENGDLANYWAFLGGGDADNAVSVTL